jgi:hypothetical protein
MSIVRLEFELDPEVYPELHAALSALRSPRARAERLRQLAASGLVWEKVRLHGTAAFAPGVAVPISPATEVRPVAAPRAAPIVPLSPSLTEPPPVLAERRAPPGKRARVSAERRRSTDFVDLAIDAEPDPMPPAPLPRGVRPTRRDVEQAIRELPVLMDVVPDVQPIDEPDDEPSAPAVLNEAVSWAPMSGYADDMPALAEVHDVANDPVLEDPDAVEAPLHVTALSHKPATKSRLMRMKDRGLFKNG